MKCICGKTDIRPEIGLSTVFRCHDCNRVGNADDFKVWRCLHCKKELIGLKCNCGMVYKTNSDIDFKAMDKATINKILAEIDED